MPSYSFKHKETGEEFDLILTLAEREEYLKDNPYVIQILTKATLVSGVRGKPDEGFRDILRSIQRSHRGSTVETF
jgi:hypothetical protein